MTGFLKVVNIQHSENKDKIILKNSGRSASLILDLLEICVLCCAQSLRLVQLFATLRIAAHQAPCSQGSPDKNTEVGCHALLQGVFPTQGLDPSVLHCWWILYHLSHQGSSLGNMYLVIHIVLVGSSWLTAPRTFGIS